MRICRSCGSVAPVENTECGRCKADFAGMVAEVEPRADGLVWARFKAHFECRSCGNKVPLNHFDVDGQIRCWNCSIEQRFKWGKWKQALQHAHDVADMAGDHKPPPDSWMWETMNKVLWAEAADMYRSIGVGKSQLVSSGGVLGEVNPVVAASPGHPVCRQCKEPLGVEVTGPGACRSWCPACGVTATFQIPEKTSKYPSLKAALSPEHRTDRPAVKTSQGTGSGAGAAAVAIACPQCGAPLPPPEQGTNVTCNYCNTTAHIPASMFHGATGKKVKPKYWWLLFDTDSPLRGKIMEKKNRRDK